MNNKGNSFNDHHNNNDEILKKQKLKRFIKITLITLSVVSLGVIIFYFTQNSTSSTKIIKETSSIIKSVR